MRGGESGGAGTCAGARAQPLCARGERGVHGREGQTELQQQARALHLLGGAVQRLVGSTIPGAGGLGPAWSLANVWTPSCGRGEGLGQAFWVSRHCDGCGGG